MYSSDNFVTFTSRIIISLVDSNGNNLSHPVTYDVPGNFDKGHPALQEPYTIKLSKIFENMTKFCDSLNRLNFKIVVFTMDPVDHQFSATPAANLGYSSMIDDYKRVFKSGEMSDLIVRASDGKEMKLHKFPLIARCAAFHRMFTVDMAENESGFLHIKDFDSVVLTEFFRFVYYNQIENLHAVDLELYKLAEKYMVAELKDECLKSIFKTILNKQIVDVLEFAVFYDLRTLFEYAAGIFLT